MKRDIGLLDHFYATCLMHLVSKVLLILKQLFLFAARRYDDDTVV